MGDRIDHILAKLEDQVRQGRYEQMETDILGFRSQMHAFIDRAAGAAGEAGGGLCARQGWR